MVAAVMVPSLAVVPFTWMVSPTFRVDRAPGLTMVTVVADDVVTVTVVPADVVTVKEPPLIDFTTPLLGAPPLGRLPSAGGTAPFASAPLALSAVAPAPGGGPPNPPGPAGPSGPRRPGRR